jgi:phage terminase large subunit-like protein
MDSFLAELAPIWKPHPGQLAFLRAKAPTKVLACGRRWGKSEVCAVEILHELMTGAPSDHLLLAPTLPQARLVLDKLIRILEKWHGPVPRECLKLGSLPCLELGGHRVAARSGHNIHSLRGFEASHIVVDEAAFVKEALIDEVAAPMLATRDGRMTLISTPNGFNHFHRYFEQGEQGDPEIWSRTAPSTENPHVRPAYLQRQKEQITSRAFLVEYMAQFLDAMGAAFRRECIEACTAAPEIHPEEVIIGVDWAAKHDYTAIVVVGRSNENFQVLEHRHWLFPFYDDSLASVLAVIERYPGATVVADATGPGVKVSQDLGSHLRGRAYFPIEFTAANKTSMVASIIVALERTKVRLPNDREFLQELLNFESQASSSHIRYNARRGYHDDYVTALGLALLHFEQLRTVGVATFSREPTRERWCAPGTPPLGEWNYRT